MFNLLSENCLKVGDKAETLSLQGSKWNLTVFSVPWSVKPVRRGGGTLLYHTCEASPIEVLDLHPRAH